MRKSLILLFVLCISYQIHAQIFWLADMKLSQSIAKEKDKLILMDFWADWCGPCKIMDKELWHLPEMQKLSTSFVGLKVNIDSDIRTAIDYNIQGIPKVVLTTFTGETIWEATGYRDAESYLSILRSIPENVKELNQSISKLAENKNDAVANILVGKEFQKLGRDSKNSNLKKSFLDYCDKYLSIAQKNSKDANLTEEIELYSSLNDVYFNKHKKALKKIESMKSEPKDIQLAELRHFILAQCYKNANNLIGFEKEKQLITSKEYIDRLDN